MFQNRRDKDFSIRCSEFRFSIDRFCTMDSLPATVKGILKKEGVMEVMVAAQPAVGFI